MSVAEPGEATPLYRPENESPRFVSFEAPHVNPETETTEYVSFGERSPIGSDGPLSDNPSLSITPKVPPKAGVSETPHAGQVIQWPSSWGPLIPWLVYSLIASMAIMIVTSHVTAEYKKFFGDSARASVISSVFSTVSGTLAFFCNGVVGFISDVKGRYPVMIVSAFVGVIPFVVLCIFAPENMWWFLISSNILPSLVGSTTFGNITTIFAMVADVYPKNERAVPMVLVLTCWFVGITSASLPEALGISRDWTFNIAAILTLLNLFLVWLGFSETLPRHERIKSGSLTPHRYKPSMKKKLPVLVGSPSDSLFRLIVRQLKQPLLPLQYVWSSPLLRGVGCVSLCLIAPLAGSEAIGVYYLQEKLDFHAKEVAVFITVIGTSYIGLSLLAVPAMTKHLNPLTCVEIGFGCLIVHEIIAAIVWDKWAAYFLLAPLTGLPFLVFPLLADVASVSVGPEEQGLVIGTVGAFRGIGGAVAPIISSELFKAGIRIGFLQLPWLLGGSVAVVGVLVAALYLKPELSARHEVAEHNRRVLRSLNETGEE